MVRVQMGPGSNIGTDIQHSHFRSRLNLLYVLQIPFRRSCVNIILLSSPGIPADVQMSIRGPVEHHPGSLIADSVWQSVPFRVERPKNHVVRPNRNGRACFVARGHAAMLICTAHHVYQPGRDIRRFRNAGISVFDPLETLGVTGHGNIADDVLVARKARPVISTLA